MTRRRMLHLPALLGTLAAAVLLACAVASLAVSEKAEATLPGKNGRCRSLRPLLRRRLNRLSINPGGGDKRKLTSGYQPSYSPDGRRIAYTAWPVFGGADAEIYTINVRGEYKTQLTHNNKVYQHRQRGRLASFLLARRQEDRLHGVERRRHRGRHLHDQRWRG
jgi:hypothetical protein